MSFIKYESFYWTNPLYRTNYGKMFVFLFVYICVPLSLLYDSGIIILEGGINADNWKNLIIKPFFILFLCIITSITVPFLERYAKPITFGIYSLCLPRLAYKRVNEFNCMSYLYCTNYKNKEVVNHLLKFNAFSRHQVTDFYIQCSYSSFYKHKKRLLIDLKNQVVSSRGELDFLELCTRVQDKIEYNNLLVDFYKDLPVEYAIGIRI